jgi:hypothetical protein
MDKKPLQSNVFSEAVMKNLQTLTDMSMEFYGSMLDNMTGNTAQFSKNLAQLSKTAFEPLRSIFPSSESCPPKQECPPHCIASIFRKAAPGERIVIPFHVENDCAETRSYRVGVRELLDEDGKPAVKQPVLNKDSLTLPPYSRQRVLVSLDLEGFNVGTYTAELVLREKEFNQNVCLTIDVCDTPGVVVRPYEEKKFRLKWQSWKSHYYCEPPRKHN